MGQTVIIGRVFHRAILPPTSVGSPTLCRSVLTCFALPKFAFVSSWLLILALAVPSLGRKRRPGRSGQSHAAQSHRPKSSDLNKVVDHLDTAIEKGLDKDNAEFAQQLLLSTLLQRGTMFSGAVLERRPAGSDSPACGCGSANWR